MSCRVWQRDGVQTLNTTQFSQLKRVITLLGSSNNIFKPAMVEEQIKAKQNKIDADTERYILNLVQGSFSSR